MFRRTLIKLTLLNTAIFLILLALLGSSVYFYTKNVLYRSVDHSLLDASQNYKQGGRPMHDQQVGVLLWDNQSNLVVAPGTRVDQGTILQNPVANTLKQLKPKTVDQITEKKVGTLYFRTLSTKIETTGGSFTAEFYTIINAQKTVLHTLLVIILFIIVVGSILAVGAGFFLAQRALKPIKEAWDRQQEFVSDASHEIRTPLTIIQSRIELLLQSPRAMIQDKIQDISTSLQETRRLSKLVSQLLILARTDSNQLELETEPVLLNELFRSVVDQFEELASYQEKTLVLEMDHQPVSILGDQERLHQLLIIFLDNALKFTKEGGAIKVMCRKEVQSVILSIEDNGVGIKPEHLSKIFNRFFQSDTSRTEREGTGLGLSIAKWIVEKHKGKLSVDSTYGKGTTFTMVFPAFKSNVLKSNDQLV